MASFKCPSCREETLSLKDKYRLGWWLTTTCSNCGARIAAFPWVLMIIFFFYTWNVVWWVALAILKGGPIYLLYMIPGWLFLDYLNISFAPLAKLKDKPQ